MAVVEKGWRGFGAGSRPGTHGGKAAFDPANRLADNETSPKAVWQACLELIRADENVTESSFLTWFQPVVAIGLTTYEGQRRLTVRLPSRFYYEWLEEHYYTEIRKAITQVLGPEGRLNYDIVIQRNTDGVGDYGAMTMQLPARRPANEPVSEHPPPAPHARAAPARKRVDPRLNATYTFYSFIEGGCNRLGRSASLAIAEDPGATPFNPFLVYGGVGLGKTHLIQAIGNFVVENRSEKNVLYVSSERFTNDFVRAIQRNRISDFSQFYRNIDLLIIDDVQFFGGKEKTQEEFFHIFNELHQRGKQIVLSADRPPREIRGIEERLLSRFHWGLTADLQPPELETRMAILNRKASDDGIEFPPAVIEFIAENITSNVRELEGALIRLLAHATLYRKEIDAAVAKEVLRDLIYDRSRKLTIPEIQKIVCEYFGIDIDLVKHKTRKREVVQARQVGMYFSKQLTQHSLKSIGTHFGGRDHSTVIHANRSVNNEIETNATFRLMMEEIRRRIEARTR